MRGQIIVLSLKKNCDGLYFAALLVIYEWIYSKLVSGRMPFAPTNLVTAHNFLFTGRYKIDIVILKWGKLHF